MVNTILKRIFLTLVLSLFAFSAFAASTNDVKNNIVKQANELGVEPAIVLSIAKIESGFNQAVRGAGGHIGVFQLSKATAKNIGVNPYDLDDNVKGGILLYKNLYNKFGSKELAVAAYNVGSEAVRRNGNSVPNHAKKFVSKVMADYQVYKKAGY